ncbi:MAG: hypothetical protein JW726_04515 [Anaerolineales bacterium]|nr:hypothetical protein [Anaerolineales bacterium]
MMKHYFAFLLRIWLGNDSEIPVWHASLEDPHTRKVIQFPHLTELEAYLNDLTESEIPHPHSSTPKES